MVKSSPAKGWEDSLEEIPTPVFLPGKFHGQRSLVGCSPWGHKELDMTERLNTHARTFLRELLISNSLLFP